MSAGEVWERGVSQGATMHQMYAKLPDMKANPTRPQCCGDNPWRANQNAWLVQQEACQSRSVMQYSGMYLNRPPGLESWKGRGAMSRACGLAGATFAQPGGAQSSRRNASANPPAWYSRPLFPGSSTPALGMGDYNPSTGLVCGNT